MLKTLIKEMLQKMDVSKKCNYQFQLIFSFRNNRLTNWFEEWGNFLPEKNETGFNEIDRQSPTFFKAN